MNEDGIEITRCISADGGEGVKLCITHPEGKRTLTISADDFLSLCVVKGSISEEDFCRLVDADAKYGALRAALRFLAAGQCSRKKLYEKLRQRHFSDADATFAADYAYGNGYIDETWQIASYVDTLFFKKNCGPRKVFAELIKRGYRAEEIRTAMDEKITEADIAAAKREFLLKKFGSEKPSDRAEAEKMRASLYRQGF